MPNLGHISKGLIGWIHSSRKTVVSRSWFGNRIEAVLLISADSEIAHPIVGRNSVDVIDDHSIRNRDIVHCENDSMSKEFNLLSVVENGAGKMTSWGAASYEFSSISCVPLSHCDLINEVPQRSLLPRQIPCLRVVREALLKKLTRRKYIDFGTVTTYNYRSSIIHTLMLFYGLLSEALSGGNRSGLRPIYPS